VTGTLRLIPSTLALMAVQRQSAASKSAKSLIKAQQSLVGGVPIITFTSPKTLAQTPSFRVSLGQVGDADGGGGQLGFGVGGVGFGVGVGAGFGVGGVGFGVGVGAGFGVGGVGFGVGVGAGFGVGVGVGVGAGFGVGGQSA